MGKLFGTDGVRGVAGKDLTCELSLQIGRGMAAVLTKLDGTPKGGCVISVWENLGLPIRFIGVGEQIDDLMEFDAESFVQSLLPGLPEHEPQTKEDGQ